jgi:hypothetical protein
MSRIHREARMGECELCGREVRKLTRHHLVPRTRHKNKKNKRDFDRQEIHRTVGLCSPCHRHVHIVLDNKQLEREYNTVEALKAHPDVEKFVRWVRRKPHGTVGPDVWHRAG